MKKFKLLLLLFLVFITSLFSKTAKIATFNALKLGKNKKDYKIMANVIKDFDIIGILEIMNRNGIEQLVKNLERITGEKWNYKITPYPVGTDSYKEFYGYIWKNKKVAFLKERGFFKYESKIFAREPYGCDFKIDNFDFTFVLIHIVFGKYTNSRRGEIFKLDKVYDYFQQLDYKENDIIIGGDFNMPASDDSFENLLNHKDNLICGIDPNIKTTIGKDGLVSAYDNIFLSLKYTKEFTGVSGALDFTGGDYKFMKANISDHLPVFVVLDISNDDD